MKGASLDIKDNQGKCGRDLISLFSDALKRDELIERLVSIKFNKNLVTKQ